MFIELASFCLNLLEEFRSAAFPFFVPRLFVMGALSRDGDRGDTEGEVWPCAGQSNMVWGNHETKDTELNAPDMPHLRYCRLDASWYKPRRDLDGPAGWTPWTAESRKSLDQRNNEKARETPGAIRRATTMRSDFCLCLASFLWSEVTHVKHP